MTWPVIRCTPGPTDAELEAERDRKHAIAVQQFMDEQTACGYCEHGQRWHTPMGGCTWSFTLFSGAITCDCTQLVGTGDV